jgi:hypothetical protein
MSAKSCGTCGRWGKPADESGGFRPCLWLRPVDLPFWASIDEGDDHADWTAADQGRRCPAWIAEEERA